MSSKSFSTILECFWCHHSADSMPSHHAFHPPQVSWMHRAESTGKGLLWLDLWMGLHGGLFTLGPLMYWHSIHDVFLPILVYSNVPGQLWPWWSVHFCPFSWQVPILGWCVMRAPVFVRSWGVCRRIPRTRRLESSRAPHLLWVMLRSHSLPGTRLKLSEAGPGRGSNFRGVSELRVSGWNHCTAIMYPLCREDNRFSAVMQVRKEGLG